MTPSFSCVRAWLAIAALALGGTTAMAQSVAMTGGMGSKALLVIDGAAPKTLSAGDVYKGVKVVSVSSEQTVVEMAGKRQTIVLGGAPVSQGGSASSGSGSQIVLTAGTGGHFRTQGSINGQSVDFIVDTGATMVSMTVNEARRLGIKFEEGQHGRSSTANGVIDSYLVTLRRVRVGDVELFDVPGSVSTGSMPFVLLGNSFLTRFQMKRDNDQMTLIKRF